MAHDARSWAEALLLLPGSARETAGRAAALEALAEALEPDGLGRASPVARLFDDPGVPSGDKADVMASLAPGDDRWGAFSALLARRGAARLVPGIAAEYRRALDRRDGTERVVLESARPLDDESRRLVLAEWSSIRKGARIIADERLVPALIGGFRLKADSVRYDASVAGRLERLRLDLGRPLPRPPAVPGGHP